MCGIAIYYCARNKQLAHVNKQCKIICVCHIYRSSEIKCSSAKLILGTCMSPERPSLFVTLHGNELYL